MELIENIHNSLIFYPSKEFFSSPAQEGIEHEEVFIDTPDGEKLHGYFLPAKGKSDKAVVYLHGNEDNVSSWFTACTEIQKDADHNGVGSYFNKEYFEALRGLFLG